MRTPRRPQPTHSSGAQGPVLYSIGLLPSSRRHFGRTAANQKRRLNGVRVPAARWRSVEPTVPMPPSRTQMHYEPPLRAHARSGGRCCQQSGMGPSHMRTWLGSHAVKGLQTTTVNVGRTSSRLGSGWWPMDKVLPLGTAMSWPGDASLERQAKANGQRR